MCVVSMVHDHFLPKFPDITPGIGEVPYQPFPVNPLGVQPQLPGVTIFSQIGEKELAELRALIADFRSAVEAAKKVDALTGQPDCVDPAKAKLEERVAALEAQIAQLSSSKKKKAKKKKRATPGIGGM